MNCLISRSLSASLLFLSSVIKCEWYMVIEILHQHYDFDHCNSYRWLLWIFVIYTNLNSLHPLKLLFHRRIKCVKTSNELSQDYSIYIYYIRAGYQC